MPDLSSLLGSGGAVAQPVDRLIVRQSMTYRAVTSGVLVGRAIGSTGSPGLAYGAGCATGAGAGEVVDFAIPVSAGDEIVIPLGAGGAAVSRSTAGYTDGNDGADTVITGPNGLSITVKAGKKGRAGPVSAGTALAGGDGGQGGTGGASHRPGGRGGNIANCAAKRAAGGGAPNFTTTFTQTATRGGDNLSASVAVGATGAGSPGGRGADILAGGEGETAGGGMGGDAIDESGTATAAADKCGPNILGQRSATAVTLISPASAPFGLDLMGNGSAASTAPGNGGGGRGRAAAAAATEVAGGVFGGLGGAVGATLAFTTSLPFWGAPGGVVASSGTSSTLKGCDAVVFLALYPKA